MDRIQIASMCIWLGGSQVIMYLGLIFFKGKQINYSVNIVW